MHLHVQRSESRGQDILTLETCQRVNRMDNLQEVNVTIHLHVLQILRPFFSPDSPGALRAIWIVDTTGICLD